MLVSYDVATTTREGKRRLRRVAKVCLNHGQRVQYSLFECLVDSAQWENLKRQLLDVYQPEEDSLRFYALGSKWRGRVEHYGTKPAVDLEAPLFV